MLRLGIDPEKPYRAICQDGLCCCNMTLISFRLFRKNLGNFEIFLRKWFTALPGKKFPVRPCLEWMRYLWLDIQYSSVILIRKRGDFEIQFYFIVLSITFKRISRDHGKGFSCSQERGIWQYIEVLLSWRFFFNILVYFNKWANNFETAR